MTDLLHALQTELDVLRERDNYRSLPPLLHEGRLVEVNGHRMLNLSSNDYLGVANLLSLRRAFLETLTPETFLPSASSSRLLTGNFTAYRELEAQLATLFHTESALVFGSGYHANMGILPAISNSRTLILADKFVHASLIDGIRLSQGRYIRYRHNDLCQLEKLVEENHLLFEKIIIVTESIFSMDGDEADLKALVALKQSYHNVWLYVDEAHAVGVRGEKGLGCAEEQACLQQIDLLVGTFGKALASAGAYIVCTEVIRDYLVNKMRTFIFTTALPPTTVDWTSFVLAHLSDFNEQRKQLQRVGNKLREALRTKGYDTPSTSHIVPMVTGQSAAAIRQAEALQSGGFYALPVRPPTVPEGTSRIRFSLTAEITEQEIDRLAALITS